MVALISTETNANAAGANTAAVANRNNYFAAFSPNHVRVRYFTRRVRYGRFIYRETYRVAKHRDGRVYTQLIDRYKIGRADFFERY